MTVTAFDCVTCKRRHPPTDLGKRGQTGATIYHVCKCCAYGYSSRRARRAAPARELCASKCWRAA